MIRTKQTFLLDALFSFYENNFIRITSLIFWVNFREDRRRLGVQTLYFTGNDFESQVGSVSNFPNSSLKLRIIQAHVWVILKSCVSFEQGPTLNQRYFSPLRYSPIDDFWYMQKIYKCFLEIKFSLNFGNDLFLHISSTVHLGILLFPTHVFRVYFWKMLTILDTI